MKTVTLLEDVDIPNMPRFRKGAEVRVADHIADLLVERAHAKLHVGKTQEEVQNDREKAKGKNTQKPEVAVQKADEKGNRKDFSNN